MSAPRGHRVPREQSRMARMRRWFKENPGDYLTADDIAVKFEISRTLAMKYMADLAQEGLVASCHVYFTNPDRPR